MLSCFGLHEWAMVYRQHPREWRHASYPLRLGAVGTDEVVERHRVTCSHFDAFRFFTPEARPRNTLAAHRRHPGPSTMSPGCLHATMDLYKWAYTLSPFVGGELVADCFELARDVRVVDMRAAPYDLASLGVRPIPIETPAGKERVHRPAARFAGRAEAMRTRLLSRSATSPPDDPRVFVIISESFGHFIRSGFWSHHPRVLVAPSEGFGQAVT